MAEINQWKKEVVALFRNHDQETANFKRYQQHYKGFLARSQGFNVDLQLMNVLMRKGALIEWREKVEDMAKRLGGGGEPSLSLAQVSALLHDGVDKGFLQRAPLGFQLSAELMAHEEKCLIAQDQPFGTIETAYKVYISLLSNFDLLVALNKAFVEATHFDTTVKDVLRSLAEEPKLRAVHFDELVSLEAKGRLLQIELDSFMEFLVFLAAVKKSIAQCEAFYHERSADSADFKLSSLDEFQTGLQLMQVLAN